MLLKALEGVITNVQFLMYNVNENVDTTRLTIYHSNSCDSTCSGRGGGLNFENMDDVFVIGVRDIRLMSYTRKRDSISKTYCTFGMGVFHDLNLSSYDGVEVDFKIS